MLPDGGVRLIEPEFAGRLAGCTLLFETLILMLTKQMPLPRSPGSRASRLTGCSACVIRMSSWPSSEQTSARSRRSRSTVNPMKESAQLGRHHLTRQSNAFLEAINGMF
jgi:hypothetical protein